jgi:hypothetical protein
MPTVTDFRDFEALKACRSLTREIGLLVRTRRFTQNRRLVDQMDRASIDAAAESATRLLGGLMRYLGDSAKRGRKYDRKPKRRRMARLQAASGRPVVTQRGKRRTANR